MDDSMDIVDGNVWLYRPHRYNPIDRLFYVRVSLSVIIAVDIVLILLMVFNRDYNIHFSVNYNGGASSWVVIYYLILLLSMIGCVGCAWLSRLSMLSLFTSSLITDVIVSLIWNEHGIQIAHWALELMSCGLVALYFSYSFGKWDFLQSQSRIDELEHLQQNG